MYGQDKARSIHFQQDKNKTGAINSRDKHYPACEYAIQESG